jgi:hypothetical protein
VVEHHVDGFEMRVVVAKILTVAANAVLVAQHLLKLGAHSYNRTGPSAGAQPRAKKQLGGEEHAGEKGTESGNM